jgi:putative transposase
MVETDDVDLGVNALATLSTGTTIEGPRAHKAALLRLRRANKALARKRRGSANFRKAEARLARTHARVANIRRDATHKGTTPLAKTYRLIGIEDLNVRGMARNRHLARSVSDGGFREFRRQLDYKPRWYGSRIVVADRVRARRTLEKPVT